MKSKQLTIAIDGHSSCGKSTLAKDLAKLLEYTHVDSGAMYRAVTHYFQEHDIGVDDSHAIDIALRSINISFAREEGQYRTCLNGVDIEDVIRTKKVASLVSPVATISAVRRFLVRQQRQLGLQGGIIMDGRDIGTIVFPDADIKFFLTASIDVRTRRRYEELMNKGRSTTSEEVRENLSHRDHIDSTRQDSPLIQAQDAVLLDTTDLDRGGQLRKAIEIIFTMSCPSND